MSAADAGHFPTPFTIAVDTREQRPYAFTRIAVDGKRGPIHHSVATATATLAAGDYSLIGYERAVAVERKSVSDLFSTLGQGRARFERELARLAAYRFAAVVVEADWSQVLLAPPSRSRLSPKTIYRSVIAWQQRWPMVHWWFCPDRAFAERTTFRILERFWKEREREKETTKGATAA